MKEISDQFFTDILNIKAIILLLIGFLFSIFLAVRVELKDALKSKIKNRNSSNATARPLDLYPVIMYTILALLSIYVAIIIYTSPFLNNHSSNGLLRITSLTAIICTILLLLHQASFIKINITQLVTILIIVSNTIMLLSLINFTYNRFVLYKNFWVKEPHSFFSSYQSIALVVFFCTTALYIPSGILNKKNFRWVSYTYFFIISFFVACLFYIPVTQPVKQPNLIEGFFGTDKQMNAEFQQLKMKE